MKGENPKKPKQASKSSAGAYMGATMTPGPKPYVKKVKSEPMPKGMRMPQKKGK